MNSTAMTELPPYMRPERSFQGLILALQRYWADWGCVILQPYDMEVGAGTFHPATTLRALGPKPWNAAYVQPSRRPKDGRYGENPNRLQHYYQYQVVIKPSPLPILDMYLGSLTALGIDPLGELLDLVLVKRPVTAETRDRVPAARRLLAVAGEHPGGDAEQPRPVRSPAGIEPGEAVHGPDERLRGEIGDRVRIVAPAREVAHEDVDVAQVHLLEFLERRSRRPPARPRPHRGRPLRHGQCSCLSAHVP